MAVIQNIESLPKNRFFSELPSIYQQLLCAEELAGIKTWDLSDIVGVAGTLQRSGKDDLFVDMNGIKLLTKSLRPLPEKHKGLTDTEQRYRQRYVDLITNEHSRDVFRTRSKIIQGIRDYTNRIF